MWQFLSALSDRFTHISLHFPRHKKKMSVASSAITTPSPRPQKSFQIWFDLGFFFLPIIPFFEDQSIFQTLPVWLLSPGYVLRPFGRRFLLLFFPGFHSTKRIPGKVVVVFFFPLGMKWISPERCVWLDGGWEKADRLRCVLHIFINKSECIFARQTTNKQKRKETKIFSLCCCCCVFCLVSCRFVPPLFCILRIFSAGIIRCSAFSSFFSFVFILVEREGNMGRNINRAPIFIVFFLSF